MARRQATEEDLTIGTTVFRSKTSKKEWTILSIHVPADEHTVGLRYSLSPGGAGFAAVNLWVNV